jgi:hypothetical protein
MKKLTTIILFAATIGLLALAVSARAQTSTNLTTSQALTIAGTNALNGLESLSLTPGFVGSAFAGNISGNSFAGVAINTLPTNNISAGVFIADFYKHNKSDVFEGNVSVAYNATATLPIVGELPCVITEGPATDISNAKTVYNENTLLTGKAWVFSKNVTLAVNGGGVYLTKYHNPGWMATANLVWKF